MLLVDWEVNGPDGSPVDADGTQVEDAGGAHHDVQREKNIAVDPTEPPFTNNLHTHLRNQHRIWSTQSWHEPAN